MSSSRQLVVQTAVRNITKTIYFSNRWTAIGSIELALKKRYDLKNIDVTRATISRKLDEYVNRILKKYHSVSGRHGVPFIAQTIFFRFSSF